MSHNQDPSQGSNGQKWDQNLIYPLLADPSRRGLLLALARQSWQPASALKSVIGMRLDATLKHLVAMRSAGVLVMKADSVDGRRQLYALAPSLIPVMTPEGPMINFGFLKIYPAQS